MTADVGTATVWEAPVVVGRRRRRWPWVLSFLLVFAVLVSGGAVAGATVSYAAALDGRFLPGTVIAGVDVSGLTQDQALAGVREALSDQLDRSVTIMWGEKKWSATMRDLGARSNASKVVADVAAAQTGLTWQDWARLRWLGEQADVAADVSIAHRSAEAREFVAAIAAEIDQEPRDASMEVRDGKVVVASERVGRRVRQGELLGVLTAAVAGDRRVVGLPVTQTRPQVTGEQFGQVLLLDQSEHELTLYLEGKKHKSWIVATGTGQYPTPLGRYKVSQKRYLPTWINPAPDGWGADMPASIGPGPGNPLGLRALNWDAPGAIRFHGTQAINSLGTDASHGCVRMANDDVVELYDLVDVGAVIISQA